MEAIVILENALALLLWIKYLKKLPNLNFGWEKKINEFNDKII